MAKRKQISVSAATFEILETLKTDGETWDETLARLSSPDPAKTTVKTGQTAKASNGSLDPYQVCLGEILDCEGDYFVNTKNDNLTAIVERIGEVPTTLRELLSVAVDVSGVSLSDVMLSSLQSHVQKIITQSICEVSGRGAIGSADGRLWTALNTLLSQLLSGDIPTVTRTKISQLGMTNPNTTNSFLRRNGLWKTFQFPLTLDTKSNKLDAANWYTETKHAAIVATDSIDKSIKSELSKHVYTHQ